MERNYKVLPKSTVARITRNKKELLIALEKALGVVTIACKTVGLERKTFYNYYNADKKFKQDVDAIQDIALDMVESQLLKQIQIGDTTAMIFYLKTKGKKRGYIERQEIVVSDSEKELPTDWYSKSS